MTTTVRAVMAAPRAPNLDGPAPARVQAAAVYGVFVVDYTDHVGARNLDVFVEVALTAAHVLTAQKRIVEAFTGDTGGALYGTMSMRARMRSHRVGLSTFERIHARRRTEQPRAAPPLRDWAPLARTIDRYFANGPPRSPIWLNGEEGDVPEVAERPRRRRRLLLAHAEIGPMAALSGLADDVEVCRAVNPWEALDLLDGASCAAVAGCTVGGIGVGAMGEFLKGFGSAL